VQWCRGLDGVVDPARIAAELRRIADPDIACLQEIASGFADLSGSRGEDQPAALGGELPDYEAVVGWGVDVAGAGRTRKRFGNMILSRLPVLQAYRHLLPYPADYDLPSMPRVAVEAVVRAEFGEVRVITTHLEYYSLAQRSAQVEALRSIYAEGHGYASNPRTAEKDEGPYQAYARPADTIITGDFNLEPDDPLHARMGAPFEGGTPPLVDAWETANPGTPHPPTFRIYEKKEPGDPELHCDFIFINFGLCPRVRSIMVDTQTQVSDHQPVLLTLE